MDVTAVSPALRQRLGTDATVGLLALLEASRQEWSGEVTNQAVERFEQQLAQQLGGLRAEMRDEIRAVDASLREEISSLRAEMRDGDAALRSEMREGDAALRLELHDTGVTLVREIAALGATLRKEMADQRVELFKWSFAFWFGQIITVGGLMTLLFRAFLS